MSSSKDFKINQRVKRGNIEGIIDNIRLTLPYTHHITWDNGQEDWYDDMPFRKGEIQLVMSSNKGMDNLSVSGYIVRLVLAFVMGFIIAKGWLF